jgi:hypothetical protein
MDNSRESLIPGREKSGRGGLLDGCFAGLREMGARRDNGQSVIRVNPRNLRTIAKAGTKSPLITPPGRLRQFLKNMIYFGV